MTTGFQGPAALTCGETLWGVMRAGLKGTTVTRWLSEGRHTQNPFV
jgi:hypothetical protein